MMAGVDERIGEALIIEVFTQELRYLPPQEVSSLTLPPPEVNSQQEQKVVDHVASLACLIGDKLQHDQIIQDAIDKLKNHKIDWNTFVAVTKKVIEGGITWEKVFALFYIGGQLAVRCVEARLPQVVLKILELTMKFFKTFLLDWIFQQGGWTCCVTGLEVVAVNSMWSGNVIIFLTGVALGILISYRRSG